MAGGLGDRFYDHYVNDPMSKIVTDRTRPAGRNDPHGVEEARTLLRTALDMVQTEMAGRTRAVGEAFTIADCAAAPALLYADKVMPFAETHPHAAGLPRPANNARRSLACWLKQSPTSRCSRREEASSAVICRPLSARPARPSQ